MRRMFRSKRIFFGQRSRFTDPGCAAMRCTSMEPVWNILVWIVLPLWVVAGFLDYLCHRASYIEHANGARESLIHWLMLAEVGLPLSLAVFFRIDALLLSLMLVCLAIHQVTGYLDLKLAMATRKVTIFEHQVHSLKCCR
jgi:hypothetical protein